MRKRPRGRAWTPESGRRAAHVRWERVRAARAEGWDHPPRPGNPARMYEIRVTHLVSGESEAFRPRSLRDLTRRLVVLFREFVPGSR
jgi:hypothetical protein